MAGISEDRNRQVIPRWRSFAATRELGELAPSQQSSVVRYTAETVDDLVLDWKDHPSLSVASSLVSVAFSLGLNQVAVDAARFVFSHDLAPPSAHSIAALYLREAGVSLRPSESRDYPADADEAHLLCFPDFYPQIHETRQQLRIFPRNPILWGNLARLYTILGLPDKAGRAMRVALSMSPGNRFILRAASRLMLHQGEKDRAHQLLVKAPSVRLDPWVLSAEIATAAVNRRTSKNLKTARRMLEAENHCPFHLSELASALGTLEAIAGNVKGSRKLILKSLSHPSENSVAQAAWLARNVGGITVAETNISLSAEAKAWVAWRAAKWDTALAETHRWQLDQPFSSRPAALGSHIAETVLEDYPQAIRFAEDGLRSNPEDLILLNNLAFALAQNGQFEKAEDVIKTIDLPNVDASNRVVLLATQGLIAFRASRPDHGRTLYAEAIHSARAFKDWRGPAARIHLALEELRIGSAHAEQLRTNALEEAAALDEPWGRPLIARLKAYPSFKSAMENPEQRLRNLDSGRE
jgi:tetratricopeptide (TPR) repeat protein